MAWKGSRFALIAAMISIHGALSMRVPAPDSRQLHYDFNATVALFDGFYLLEDLGYMHWYTNCSVSNRSRSCAGDVDVEEVRCGLGANHVWKLPEAYPRDLYDLARLRGMLPVHLPYRRRERKRLGYFYKLPYAMPPVAAPFAASQRFDLSKIDFIIGGSLLYALATGDFHGNDYTVQRWGDAVMIRRYSSEPDFVDVQNKGMQIKRLVLGKHMDDLGLNESSIEHLQVLRIGAYNVLFIGEVDALDRHGPRGRRAEIKSVSVPNWRQIMFQMIAKGSMTLLHTIVDPVPSFAPQTGRKGKGLYLNRIDDYDLRDIVLWSTTHVERARLAFNIIDALSKIHAHVFKSSAGEGGLARLNGTTYYRSDRPDLVWTHTPKLHFLEDMNRSLLPEPNVMHVLFPHAFRTD